MITRYEKPVDYDAVVQRFAEQQPRRMLLVDPIFEETQAGLFSQYKYITVMSVLYFKIGLDYCEYLSVVHF